MKKLIGVICILVVLTIAGLAFFQSGSAKNFEETVRVKKSNSGDLIGGFKSFQNPEGKVILDSSFGFKIVSQR